MIAPQTPRPRRARLLLLGQHAEHVEAPVLPPLTPRQLVRVRVEHRRFSARRVDVPARRRDAAEGGAGDAHGGADGDAGILAHARDVHVRAEAVALGEEERKKAERGGRVGQGFARVRRRREGAKAGREGGVCRSRPREEEEKKKGSRARRVGRASGRRAPMLGQDWRFRSVGEPRWNKTTGRNRGGGGGGRVPSGRGRARVRCGSRARAYLRGLLGRVHGEFLERARERGSNLRGALRGSAS